LLLAHPDFSPWAVEFEESAPQPLFSNETPFSFWPVLPQPDSVSDIINLVLFSNY
jgi:hypothetical protein